MQGWMRVSDVLVFELCVRPVVLLELCVILKAPYALIQIRKIRLQFFCYGYLQLVNCDPYLYGRL
jgi:hypothetical protein